MRLAALSMLCFACSLLGAQPRVVAYTEGSCCSVVYENGIAYFVIVDGSTSVVLSRMSDYSARIPSFYISIKNLGKLPLDVDPSLFSATENNNTLLSYLDMDAKAAKDLKRHNKNSLLLMMLVGGLNGAAAAQPQVATVNNSNGSNSTVTYVDPNAQIEANDRTAQLGSQVRSRNNEIFETSTINVLRRNTLQENGSVAGVVYFASPSGMKAAKKASIPMQHVDIVLDGTIYRF